MSILKFLRRLFGKPQAKVIDMKVTAIGGKECPVCEIDGLFHYAGYYQCEECFTRFDDNMNIIIEKRSSSLRYRDDGGTDGG